VILSISFIPLNIYWYSKDPNLGFDINVGSIIGGILFMIPCFMIGWMFLLKTNNPITRYNPFSFNPKWESKMRGSLEENPGQMFEMDAPDENEVKRVIRNKKLDQLLK
jgi:hypothetical protein